MSASMSAMYNVSFDNRVLIWHSTKHGLDCTGQLNWTVELDSWTGQLDWAVGLDYWTGFPMGFFSIK